MSVRDADPPYVAVIAFRDAWSSRPSGERFIARIMNVNAFDVLTFDVYGTIIDWETGILEALQPVFKRHGVRVDDEALLEAYAAREAAIECGPYRSYRDVLARSLAQLGQHFGCTPTSDELARFSTSVRDWPAFPDSAAALAALKGHFKLAPISNCDDDLLASSIAKIGIDFDWIVTAQQARSYKPSLATFRFAFDRIPVARERMLHVAQSLFHDHVPAKALGLATVWVNRRHGKPGYGATPPATASPDLEVPDLATLAALAAR